MQIVDLKELSSDAQAIFGGKACGLAKLFACAARVPHGFAVEATTASPEEWPPVDQENFHFRATQLLKSGPVAIRSSAVGEDSFERSFAGLFETVLGTHTSEEILAAAARCIASGGSTRVLEYAEAQSPLAVGLVMQTMVNARAAGVCFTKDPAGKDGAILIEAVEGLGDKLVSGAASPERWRVYRSGLGGYECRVERSHAVLSETQVERIALEAAGLAAQFQYPLDLEWALDHDNTLWWLQARPTTSALAPPVYTITRSFEDVDDGPISVWSNWNVRETMPNPLFPLTWTVARDVVIPMVNNQLIGISDSSHLMQQMCGLDLVNGRVYFNLNALAAAPLYGFFATRILAITDARAGEIMSGLISSGVLRPRKLPGPRAQLFAGMITATLTGMLRMTNALMPRRALKMLEKDGASLAARCDVAKLSHAELIEEIKLFTHPECRRIRYGLQLEAVAMIVFEAALRAFKDYPKASSLLATGIPDNPTTQISLCIEQLVENAHPCSDIFLSDCPVENLMEKLQESPEGRAWILQFKDFLNRFGHRGPAEFDMGAERWSENPMMILNLIRQMLKAPSKEKLSERMARLAHERADAIKEAVQAAPGWRRPLMRILARLVEAYMPLREAPKHYGVIVFQRMRQAAMELGRRMAGEGIINAPADVFFLEWPEVQALAHGERPKIDFTEMVRERKQKHERFQKERAPNFLRSDGVPVDEEDPSDKGEDGILRGTPVSAGQAVGPVRILTEPDPLVVQEGDVLVMEFADPGWTPLFPRAGAVIMEVGGLMCHAAVVAREIGVPAVFGVSGATRMLSDGRRVIVDGTLGIVRSA